MTTAPTGIAPSIARWHRARLLLGWLTFASVVATMVLLVVRSRSVWIAGSLFLALLAIGVVVHLGAWHAARTGSDAERARRAGIRTAVHILLVMALGTMVVACLVLETASIAAGAVAVFASLAIFGAPAWLASIGEEEDDARERDSGAERREEPPRGR